MENSQKSDLMRDAEVADYLGIKPRTLKGWRTKNFGPPYIQLLHGVAYRRSTVDQWLSDRQVAASTKVSEAADATNG